MIKKEYFIRRRSDKKLSVGLRYPAYYSVSKLTSEMKFVKDNNQQPNIKGGGPMKWEGVYDLFRHLMRNKDEYKGCDVVIIERDLSGLGVRIKSVPALEFLQDHKTNLFVKRL